MSELIEGRFVAGMSWASIVAKGDRQKLAKQKAAKEKGNWYAHNGTEQNVGIAQLNSKEKPAKDEHFFSAARIAAALTSFGPNFYALALPAGSAYEGKVWICAVIDGVPVNQWDAVVSEVEAPQRLEAFLLARGLTSGECGIYGDASGMPPGISPLNWEETMRYPGDGEFAWLKSTNVSFVDSLSPQKKALGVGVLAVLAIYFAWGQYSDWKKKRDQARQVAEQLDPVVEWGKTMQAWQQTKRAPGGEPLLMLRRAMTLIPLEVSGWDLQAMDCSLTEDSWVCLGVFDRTKNRARDPTTGEFLRARPTEWIVTPKTLDAIEVNFRIPVQAAPFEFSKAETSGWHMERTTSELQKGFRAFSSVSMADFVPVPLSAPVRADGSALEKPPGFVSPVVSAVSIAGPMRSLDLSEIAGLPTTWTNVRVRILNSADQPGLVLSAVMMEARGEIYAKQ